MLTSLAAAAAIALTASSTPIVGLPRISNGVPTTDVPLAALAPPAAERAQPGSRLGVQILGGTTAGGTGSPWVRDPLYDKQSDDREMRALKAAERKNRTWEKVLIGVGVFAAASAVGMIASTAGNDQARSPARRMQLDAAGPRGGGAAFVWKVGFR